MRDTDFEISIGKAGGSAAPRLGPLQGLVGRAKRGSSRSAATRMPQGGLKGHFRKSAAKGTVNTRGFLGANRRVIVKTRIVAHGASGAAPAASIRVVQIPDGAFLAR